PLRLWNRLSRHQQKSSASGTGGLLARFPVYATLTPPTEAPQALWGSARSRSGGDRTPQGNPGRRAIAARRSTPLVIMRPYPGGNDAVAEGRAAPRHEGCCPDRPAGRAARIVQAFKSAASLPPPGILSSRSGGCIQTDQLLEDEAYRRHLQAGRVPIRRKGNCR